ncbi:MAG TPA: BTAD domain-containing putative transcriptional regulator [Streptosporangiaceae bacterium]|jgi:DNA-binding SARP family transcriptional activator
MTGNAMSHEPGGLDIRLLGSLSVSLNHRPVTPSAAKQRQILALLALNAGRVATVSTLVEELWGDHPPRSWPTTLQTYILQLRNRLAAAAGAPARDARRIIATRHGGYLLEAPVCRSDVGEFKRLARDGREVAEAGDHRGTSDLLGRALALWSGPALVDVRTGRILELEATSLEETRLGVLERRLEADLALGRHADVLGELTKLTARNPMNENFCGLLMTALYRSGHAGRSLEAFQRLRTLLRNDLGIEPGPRLQRLQRAVLSGDPHLHTGPLPAPAADTRAGADRRGGVARQRPPLPQHGRSVRAS